MKKMSVIATQKVNGGSVRCSSCGWTTWGVNDCKNHIRNSHRHGFYVWYRIGPTNRFTASCEHRKVIANGYVW